MSQFTDYGENAIADKIRGVEPTYPAPNWFVAFGSAASDSTFTEITGANLARKSIPRDLASWAGTQGAGTTVASNGTSHETSNNIDIQFAAATANLAAPATHWGLFDALSGGHCWVWLPITGGPLVINNTDTPVILAGDLRVSLGLSGSCTSALVNKLIDEIFRGQAWAFPASLDARLFTTAADDSGAGVEVAAGDYARPTIASTFAAWSATQGGTGASNGSAGRIANLAALEFPAPLTDWGDIRGDGLGIPGGALLFRKTYVSAKTVSANSSAPSWSPGKLGIGIR